jgi:predicted nucleic acid-binding Zn ribbon protein
MVAIGAVIILLFAERVLKLKTHVSDGKKKYCPFCEKAIDIGETFCSLCGRLLKQMPNRLTARSIGSVAILLFIVVVVAASQASSIAYATTDLLDLDINSIRGPDSTILLPEIDGWDLEYAYRDSRVEQILNQDASLVFKYVSKSYDPSLTIAMQPTVYSGVQIADRVHKWETSLVTVPSRYGRPTVSIIELTDVVISEDQKGRFFVYQRPGSQNTEAVLYWIERVPLRFGSEIQTKNVHIILWSYTSNLARLNIIDNANDIEGTKRFLLSFALDIDQYRKKSSVETQGQTTIGLIVNQNLYVLLGMTVLPTSLISMRYQLSIVKQKHQNNKLYKKLPPNERGIIDAVINANKPTIGQSVANTYEKLIKKTIANHDLRDMLQSARDSTLIKTHISSINDKPCLVWHANISERAKAITDQS